MRCVKTSAMSLSVYAPLLNSARNVPCHSCVETSLRVSGAWRMKLSNCNSRMDGIAGLTRLDIEAAHYGKVPIICRDQVTSVVPVSQTTCTLSLSFAFEEGSKLPCACRIVMVPTDSPLALACS